MPARRGLPMETLFREKFVEVEGGCWVWTATRFANGYAQFPLSEKTATGASYRKVLGHRFSYELFRGRIPDGLTIDHLCRNRACVNPQHLEAVTQLENNVRAKRLIAYCPRGHAYDETNTYVHGRARHCRTCRKSQRSRRAIVL